MCAGMGILLHGLSPSRAQKFLRFRGNQAGMFAFACAQAGRSSRMYKIYWADGPVGPEIVVRKRHLPRRQYRRVEDALGWARRVAAEGGTAWLIEGDDGTRLGRHEIADLVEALPRAQDAACSLQ